MTEHFRLGEISIRLTRKAIKHVHLSVHPPTGRVTMVAPEATRLEVARAYAISKLRWIREQQRRFQNQSREAPRKYIERESQHLWGRRYMLAVEIRPGKPAVTVDHRRLTLHVRPNTNAAKRAQLVRTWHKQLLHQTVPTLIRSWEPRLGVTVKAYYLQRMKTKWGSCNHRAGHIRLNTELVKKPKELLEYVIVHEMIHLLEPRHSARFQALLDQHYPSWKEARQELNELPLASWD